MYSTWRVGIVLSAMNLTGPGFAGLIRGSEDAAGKVEKLQSAMNALRIGAAFALGEVGRLGVEGFMHAADSAGQLQNSLTLLSQQTKASTGDMQKLYQTAISLSSGRSRTIFSTLDVVNAERMAQQSGLTPSQIMRSKDGSVGNSLIGQMMYAAELEKMRGGDSNPENTVRALSSVVKGYHLTDTPDKMADFVNEWTKVQSQSHMTPKDLQVFETYFGTTARLMGLSPKSFLDFAGYFKQQGMSSSTAATSLANFMMNSAPHVSMGSSHTTAQTAALSMLGDLNKVDIGKARTIYEMYRKASADIGLPTNMSQMTAKQLNAFAETMARLTLTSKMIGSKTHQITADDIVGTNTASLTSLVQKLGPELGQQFYLSLTRQAYNLRGTRAAAILSDKDKFDAFEASVRNQVDLTDRIGTLRNQFEGLKASIPNQMGTIFQQLGGVQIQDDGHGHAKVVATPGGPLDIMTKVFREVADFLGKVADFGASHAQLMAQLGTLMGVVGVAGLVGAAGLATLAVVALTRSLWEMSGAGAIAAGTNTAGVVRMASRGLGGLGTALLGGETLAAVRAGMWGGMRGRAGGMWDKVHGGDNWLFGKHGGAKYTDMMEERPVSRLELLGHNIRDGVRPTQVWAKQTYGSDLARMGEGFAETMARLAPFLDGLVKIGLRVASLAIPFLDVIMLLDTVRVALSFVHDHAFDIGEWAAIIVHGVTTLMGNLWGIISTTFTSIVGFIGMVLQKIWYYAFHPGDARQGLQDMWGTMQKGYGQQMYQYMDHNDREKYLSDNNLISYRGQLIPAANIRGMPGSGGNTPTINAPLNLTINGANMDAKTLHKTVKEAHDNTISDAVFNLRRSGSDASYQTFGGPGLTLQGTR